LLLNEMFVGVVSHDLRSPLSAITMTAQLLGRQSTDDKQLVLVRRMTSATDRMARMIDQLLDLTRARLGRGIALLCASVDICDLVQRAVEEARSAAPDREITVHKTGDCMAMGDTDRLLQVFANLIGNAIRHGAQGSPVTVRVHGERDEVVVRVHNMGAIPPG